MSFTVHRRVPKEKWRHILPRKFGDRYRAIVVSEVMSVVIFDDEVVRSSRLMKAIAKMGERAFPVVFVARDFTQESRQLISDASAQLIDLVYFGWTDESKLASHTSLGAKVKLPARKEPNQSLEPTPMLGTSAAEQPLVPSTVVAHL